MKNWLSRGTSAFLVLFALAQAEAQRGPAENRASVRSSSGAQQEEIVGGTVASLLPEPATGMLPGSHLLLTTLNGPVDVNLGAFALKGKDSLLLSTGEQIEVTGAMGTFNRRPVLLARTVTVRDRTYAIRNEHGIPITPKARERAAANAQNQETR